MEFHAATFCQIKYQNGLSFMFTFRNVQNLCVQSLKIRIHEIPFYFRVIELTTCILMQRIQLYLFIFFAGIHNLRLINMISFILRMFKI